MTALVIAEHDNKSIRGATLNTVTAAAAAGGEVHVLVAGHNASGAAQAASKIAGVTKVLHAEAPGFEHGLAENLAAQVIAIAGSYSHLVFPATAAGKNVAPRVAALLDHAAVLEDDDQVGVPNGRQPMRDDERGALREQHAQGLLDSLLRADVDRRGRLVEDEDARVCKQGARERDELALAE